MDLNINDLWQPLYDIIGDRDKTDAVLAVLQDREDKEKKRRLQLQRLGLEKAVEAGVNLGRPKSPMPKSLPRVISDYETGKISSKEAAGALSVTLGTFYRYVKRYKYGWDR